MYCSAKEFEGVNEIVEVLRIQCYITRLNLHMFNKSII